MRTVREELQMRPHPRIGRHGARLVALAAALLAASVVAAPAGADPTSTSTTPAGLALPPPSLPGVAPLPGPLAAAAQPSPSMGVLQVSPEEGVADTPFTVTGAHLPADAAVQLTWSTADVTWVADPEPDSVNYLGRSATKLAVVLATATTDAGGSFSVKLTAPHDWGGVHDLYAVVGGAEDAHGGFVVERSVTVTPRRGPVGTPITVTYSGLGASLYEGGASLLWDNHFVGEMTANWTRGTAVAVIRAAGPVGPHTIEVGDAVGPLYLNIQQSPLPFALGGTVGFEVTKDGGRPRPSIDWPRHVTPTVSARTTLQASGLSKAVGARVALASTSGAVHSSDVVTASGLTSAAPVQLVWSTVVGSRVNCTSTCWSFVSDPLGMATPSDGTLTARIHIPDGLGGWHVVQLVQGGQTVGQVPFYVKESVVGRGVSQLVLHQGEAFTVHLKGVGWTQLDNTVAVDYDNSFIGYGCGFNSNGDVVLQLHATGGPGTHLIDIYPELYTQQPSFPNTPYGMVPILTYASDDPGLALGYQLPAIRLAITVVP